MRAHVAGESSTIGPMNRRSWLRVAIFCCPWMGGAVTDWTKMLAATPSTPAADDLFQAMNDGKVEARVVARDANHVRVFFKNLSKQPLTVKLPEVLAARPVLAQANFFNPQQGGGGLGMGSRGGQQAPQAVAGPASGGNRNGNIFNIPPESVRELRVDSVCLEHGKPDPRSAVTYELVKLEEVCSEPAVESLLARYGAEGLDRDVVQAAAWNLANDLGWSELEQMSEPVAINATKPIYTSQQLQLARRLTETALKATAGRKKAVVTVATPKL